MSKMIIDLDISKCCACGACAVACMDQNDIEVSAGQRPLRSVFEYEEKKKGEINFEFFSLSCMHCDDAPCINACPCGCIEKDPKTGMTIYDNSRCIGCHSCSMACPFGAPSFDKNGKMIKCDGCSERIKHGMQPACTMACPSGALICMSGEDYKKSCTAKSMHAIVSAIK